MAAFSQIGWNPLSGLIDWLSDAFQNTIVVPIMNFFSYLIGCIFYGLQMGLFYIMDAIQLVFRRVAGLDIYYDNGVAVEGDLVIKFLQDSTVQAVFFSILIAAIILLFITTFIAVLKTEFDEKDNAKGPVFKSALKAIAYFAIVPVVCFLGIMVSNIVLRMLDGATSRDAQSFSTQLFTAAAWDANRARNDADFAKEVYLNCKWIPGMSSLTLGNTSEVIIEEQQSSSQNSANQSAYGQSSGPVVLADGDVTLTAYDQEAIADLIDQAFRGAYAPTTGTATIHGNKGWDYEQTFSVFSITSYDLVFYFYDPISYNYLIGYVGGFAICMLMLNLLIGVIQRIFELCVLFVLSPAAVALMPLDGGGRYNAWRGMFVRRVFSAYGPILGMNLVFMVLTLMQDVTIFPDGGINGLYNAIVQLIFIFTGLVSIRSLVDLVTELVGQGDALKQGEATAKQVQDFGSKAIGAAANIYMTPVRAGLSVGKNAKRRIQNRRAENKALDTMAFDSAGGVRGRDAENREDGYNRSGMFRNARNAMAAAGNRATGGRYFSEGAAAHETDREQRSLARNYLRGGAHQVDKDGNPILDEEGNQVAAVPEGRYRELSNTRKEITDSLGNAWDATGLDKKIEESAGKFGDGVPIIGGIAKFFKGRSEQKADKKAKAELLKQEAWKRELFGSGGTGGGAGSGSGGAGSGSGGSPSGGAEPDIDFTEGAEEAPAATIADNERIFNQNYGDGTPANVNVMNTPTVTIKQEDAEESPPVQVTWDDTKQYNEMNDWMKNIGLNAEEINSFQGGLTVDDLNDYGQYQYKMKYGNDNSKMEEFLQGYSDNGEHLLKIKADKVDQDVLKEDTDADEQRMRTTAMNIQAEQSDIKTAEGDKLKIDDEGIKNALGAIKGAINITANNIENKLENIQANTRATSQRIDTQTTKLDSIAKDIKQVSENTGKKDSAKKRH